MKRDYTTLPATTFKELKASTVTVNDILVIGKIKVHRCKGKRQDKKFLNSPISDLNATEFLYLFGINVGLHHLPKFLKCFILVENDLF